MKKIIFIIVASIIALVYSCEPNNNNKMVSNKGDDGINKAAAWNNIKDGDMIILGDKKENPYSIKNMRVALDTLMYYIKNSNQKVFEGAFYDNIKLETTDLYVRFLPQDSLQYDILKSDTSLILFDFPLDYEIKQRGTYYCESGLNYPYTWYYTTVKPGYISPKGIKYEVLEELFILENSPYYSEEKKKSKSTNPKAQTNMDMDFFEYLQVISFINTGNEKELDLEKTYNNAVQTSNMSDESPISCITIKDNCVTKKFLWWTWESCDTYYYPDGHIYVNTPHGNVPLKGVKMRLWRWFYKCDVRIDGSGYYCSTERFNKLFVGNNMSYRILFDGQNGNNSWELKATIFGGACLWGSTADLGSHSPDGLTKVIYPGWSSWGKAVVSNAIYDYCDIARKDGIYPPPWPLDVATRNNKSTGDFVSSAPLLKKHFNISLLYAMPNIMGLLAKLYSYIFSTFWPDLILNYTEKGEDYDYITATVWHELTHASQLTMMVNEKNFFWASDYWSANVYQQAKNGSTRDKDPYGKKGGKRWQTIALSEGWAYFREWYTAKTYLDYDAFRNEKYDKEKKRRPSVEGDYVVIFPRYYAGMFDELYLAGCSFANMEKALACHSFSNFEDNLVNYYPRSFSLTIHLIIQKYENYEF